MTHKKQILTRLLLSSLVFLASCGSNIRTPESFVLKHAGTYAPAPKIAVIIEPRKHPLLAPIVENMMQVLGGEWKVQIFHGTQNRAFIEDSALGDKIKNGQIYLTEIDRENVSIEAYNALLLSPYFWQNVLGENVLIFQTDTVLCGDSKYKIGDFMKYDYVGAPWSEKRDFFCHTHKARDSGPFRQVSFRNSGWLSATGHHEVRMNRVLVGNGGLSFRKRSGTLEVLERFSLSHEGDLPNEDIFYGCVAAESDSGFNAPTIEEAKNFSVESVFNLQPFGVHKPWLNLKKDQLAALEGSCPEITQILKPYYTKNNGVWGQ